MQLHNCTEYFEQYAVPLIVSATVNYTAKTLTITGQSFGSNPPITLDSLTFPTQSAASNQSESEEI